MVDKNLKFVNYLPHCARLYDDFPFSFKVEIQSLSVTVAENIDELYKICKAAIAR